MGGVCCVCGGNKTALQYNSIFSVTLFEWTHDIVCSFEIQWYDTMFECLCYIVIKPGQLSIHSYLTSWVFESVYLL